MSPSTLPAVRLSAYQLRALRGQLEQERSFRLEQIGQLHRHTRHDRLGAADREVTAALLAGAQAALRDIHEALRRMDHGGYGMCRQCAAPLPIERLEVLPHLALCMSCQRASEFG